MTRRKQYCPFVYKPEEDEWRNDIQLLDSDSLTKRSENCPGKVEDDNIF